MHSVVLLALIAYRFDAPVSRHVVDAMQEETTRILERAGIEFQWWDRNSPIPMPEASQIYVLGFHGHCGPISSADSVHAPLAVTHVVDGEVLPFSDVDCDQIRATARNAFGFPRDLAKREEAFGRALARVAAHELVHSITKSAAHGRRGVARAAFTQDDLTADEFSLAPEDVDRVRDCFR
ncbi:MAG: hypothetical protein JSU00_23815 [Acidobacteria bacterium]|mgnify:CR=1 FL=1|nr:hypothetical protein [Acidobacteriota bacterium]